MHNEFEKQKRPQGIFMQTRINLMNMENGKRVLQHDAALRGPYVQIEKQKTHAITIIHHKSR